MTNIPDKYFNLSFEKAIQNKILEFINLVLPEGYRVTGSKRSPFPNYEISCSDGSVPCGVANYFWSNGPSICFRTYDSTEGKKFLLSMKETFDLDNVDIMRC